MSPFGAGATGILAQSFSYRVTRLEVMAVGITWCPIRRITVCLSRARFA
jgi:hypothetical protein